MATGNASLELEQVKSHWAGLRDRSYIYALFLNDVSIVSASNGVFTAHLQVSSVHLNSKKTLHGSVSACITDWAGGLAIASTGLENTGVSTDIHTTYISTAKEGDTLEVEGRAFKVGRTLAFTTVEIRKILSDGSRQPVANGTHTKCVVSN